MPSENLLVHLREKYKEYDTHGFNFFDFLHLVGSPLDALLYAQLFWPDFIEIEGMVFMKEIIEDEDDKARLSQALKRFNGDKTQVEKSFNLIEIPYLFGKRLMESTDDEDQLLAERLAEMWQQRLTTTYPAKKLVVEVVSPEQTGSEISILFYTCRT